MKGHPIAQALSFPDFPNGRSLNRQRCKRDIIVVGTSAGGVEVLSRLFQELSPSIPASISVVMHRSPHGNVRLMDVIARRSALPVREAKQGMLLKAGHIYLAPSDQHMTLEDGHLALTRGPKEHNCRPSIDPLFRSAAAEFGPRVAALLLSGGGDDGVNGMIAVKGARGLSLVQDPNDSFMPYMPMNAIRFDDVDGVLPIASIASVLFTLAIGSIVQPHREA